MSAPLRVLLVEDNEGDVEMTRCALSESRPQCKLSIANDGVAALELLSKLGDISLPQLIMLDLNMPRMDGRQFLEHVKAEPHFKVIPVVMLTSSESPDDIRSCYERHASCYVVKPFDGREFAGAIREIVSFWCTRGRTVV